MSYASRKQIWEDAVRQRARSAGELVTTVMPPRPTQEDERREKCQEQESLRLKRYVPFY